MAADTAPDLGVQEWRDAVLEAERNGELLLAFDRADRALALHPSDRWLQHRAVLALARAGSTDEAERRFDAYGLADVDDEDAAALGARIAKDRALAAEGSEHIRRARTAADGYHDVFRRTNGYYSAINAATMSLVARDRDGARPIAGRALDLVAGNKLEITTPRPPRPRVTCCAARSTPRTTRSCAPHRWHGRLLGQLRRHDVSCA